MASNPAILLVLRAVRTFLSLPMGTVTLGEFLSSTFNFHFLTPNPFTYRSYLLLDKRFRNRIQIKIFLFETFSL